MSDKPHVIYFLFPPKDGQEIENPVEVVAAIQSQLNSKVFVLITGDVEDSDDTAMFRYGSCAATSHMAPEQLVSIVRGFANFIEAGPVDGTEYIEVAGLQ